MNDEREENPQVLTAYQRWEVPAFEEAGGAASRLPTAEQIEAIRKAAYEEGFAEGRQHGEEKGYQAGFSRGENEVQENVTRLNHLLDALREPVDAEDEKLIKTIVAMIRKITLSLLQRELDVDSSVITGVARAAIECMSENRGRVTVFLHPQDISCVEKLLQESVEGAQGLRLVPQPTITPGGCLVETENEIIDATLDSRLDTVVEQLLRVPQPADSGSED